MRLAIAGISLLLSLLALEYVLRLAGPQGTIIGWPVADKRYGFMNRKNFTQEVRYKSTNATWKVRINSLGLRGPELDFSDTKALRILLLGDSFTFGYGVNESDSFGARLADRLERAGRKTMIINASAAGWGTRQEFLFASDHLELFRPDVVILTFCGNDHVDDEVFASGAAGGLLPGFPGKHWIRNHSYLYGAIYRAMYGRMYVELLHKRAVPPAVPAAAPAAAPPAAEDWRALLDQRWTETEKKIHDFAGVLKASRPHSLLLLQSAEFWKPEIESRLAQMGNGQDIVYISLTNAFQGVAEKDILLGFDRHWNQGTHDRVAEQIFNRISALPAVPRP